MKTHDEVLQVLGDLSPTDRMWIVDRLSPAARGALLNGVAGPSNQNPSNMVQASSPSTLPVEQTKKSDPVSDLLDAADPRQIAAAFAGEPAWVVHAALTRNRPWKSELADLLPASLRNEIEELDRSHIRYADKLVASIEAGLAAALESTPVSEPSSWFEGFVSGLRTRISSRRMRLRA